MIGTVFQSFTICFAEMSIGGLEHFLTFADFQFEIYLKGIYGKGRKSR